LVRTTLNLDDELYRRAKATAALRGCSVTSLIEDSLRQTLSAGPPAPVEPMPVSTRRPGLAPAFAATGLDLNDTSAVLETIDR
jgi:hypothetical protein